MNLLEKDIPNPFGRGLVDRLNPEVFDRIEGFDKNEGQYEEVRWDEHGRVDDVICDVGPAVNIHSANLDLYESSSAYHLVFPDHHNRYMYPKSDFTLVMKNIPSLFDLT